MTQDHALLYCEVLSLVMRLPEATLVAFLERIVEGAEVDELIRMAEQIAPEELDRARRELRGNS